MKIKQINSYVVSAPMKKPWKIANYVLSEGSAIFVEIITDSGICGYGECISRFSPQTVKSVIDNLLAPVLINEDPIKIEEHWKTMINFMRNRGHIRGFFIEAISGIDIALWDIFGKNQNLPLNKLLGGCGRTKVPVYASSIFWDTPEEMAKVAEKLVKEGYKFIKVKIGQGIKQDYLCLKQIRSAAGQGTLIAVDSNCAYDTKQALKLGKLIEELEIYWFEEPVKPDNVSGYKFLSENLNCYIAGGEAEFTVYGFRELLMNGLNMVQPNVTRAGGVTSALKIANLAEAFGAYYCPHTGACAAICMATSLQLAAAVPNFLTYEYMIGENPLVDELMECGLPIPVNGYIDIPQEPGIGIKINKKLFEKFIVD